jgi:osmotically inducible protein OsmC
MPTRHAYATWDGPFARGRGSMKPDHADLMPVVREARFEEAHGTSPEELVGAALASCFSMALASGLERAGMTPVSIRTDARVHFDELCCQWQIRLIELSCDVRIPDGDEAMLRAVADETLRACPMGMALLNVPIELEARLIGPSAQPTAALG